MRRVGLVMIGLCVLGFAGCASDDRQPLVEEVIRQLDTAQAKLKSVQKSVNEAVTAAQAKAKKDNRETKTTDLPATDLEKAVAAAKGLREASKSYLEAARKAQNLSEPITAEQQEKYAKELGPKVQRGMEAVQAETDRLNAAIKEAERINPNSTTELHKELQQALAEYESASKRS